MSYPAKILLIKLVKQHEELWNSRSPHYARSDIKALAWEDISARMAANGFESKISRLKVMWKSLRDQWKRNVALKLPTGREWYFQRRINFLADTYEEGLHLAPYDQEALSPEYDAPDDSLYSVKPDDSLEDQYATEGSLLIGQCSPAPQVEPKLEVKHETLLCGETLITVPEERIDTRRGSNHSVKPVKVPTAASTPNSAPSMKRLRPEVRSEGPTHSRVREGNTENVESPSQASKEATNGNSQQQSDHNSQNKGDKFDKYAAFIASTLREMPDAEARKRMKEMTMLLLEGLD